MSHPDAQHQPDLPPPRWSLLPMHADADRVRSELRRAEDELSTTQASLDEALGQLDTATDRLRTALGMAAHDLRSPAGSIRGFAETLLLLARDRLEPRELDMLDRIVDASNRMLRIVEELLALAEVDDHGAALELEVCDLRAVVDEAVEVASISAADKEITLHLSAPASVPVHADPGRLTQVLLNLLSNAVNYSNRGSDVEVTVDADDDEVRIAVADHGVGIPEDELDDLFEPFTRASSRPTEGESSTGLGLTIADRFVRAHHGQLAVTSTLGEGSVFTVTFPRSVPHDHAGVAIPVSRRSDSRGPSSR